MDLADVAHELYGLLPRDFTAERNQRAKDLKADGDADLAAQVIALGKPTSAAWLVNQLVRHHGEEVEQVAAVGAALREAQDDLGSGELMALNKQRHLVLRAVVQQARALARDLGQPVSTAVADEVEQTLRAVMSDPDAADAVRTGTLRRALSGTGLGPVDLTDAVALPVDRDAQPGRRPAPTAVPGRGGTSRRGTGRAPADAGAPTSGARTSGARTAKDELAERRRQHERERRERERAEREREQAAKALAEARRFAEEADEQAASADDALEQAQEALDGLVEAGQRLVDELQALERQVRESKSRLDDVQREAQAAERARDQARHDAEVAHRAADRARTRLERLT